MIVRKSVYSLEQTIGNARVFIQLFNDGSIELVAPRPRGDNMMDVLEVEKENLVNTIEDAQKQLDIVNRLIDRLKTEGLIFGK